MQLRSSHGACAECMHRGSTRNCSLTLATVSYRPEGNLGLLFGQLRLTGPTWFNNGKYTVARVAVCFGRIAAIGPAITGDDSVGDCLLQPGAAIGRTALDAAD
jgi:hypothetical protein